MNNDFVDYCIGITFLLLGIGMFIIAIGLVNGAIK